MPVRFIILRVILGLLCTGFACLLGRSLARGPEPARRGMGTTAWAVRTVIAGAALLWGTGLDVLAGGFYGLALLAGILGFLWQRRPKKHEEVDLVKEMFPKQ